MASNRPRVVIVGAGFGGLWAARAFAHTDFQVLLIDRNNYHTFLPLLYQVAAAEVEPEEIVYPVRSILRPLGNVDFLLADVQGIDFDARTLQTSVTAVPYDYWIPQPPLCVNQLGMGLFFVRAHGAIDSARGLLSRTFSIARAASLRPSLTTLR